MAAPPRNLLRRVVRVFAAVALVSIARSPSAAARPVTMGETPKPPAQPAASAEVPGAAAALAKGPYLQALGPTGVTIKLELGAPGPASVEIVPAGGAAVVARQESSEARSFHALRVDGLLPATAYEYRVTAGGARGDPGRFTTAPVDGRPFRFLAYGDSRSDVAAHAAVIRAMEGAPGDFLISTGDMVSMGNEPRDWSELFAIEGPLLRDRCVFAAVGNHELARGDRAGEVAFLRYFAAADEGREIQRLYGSFRWSNTRFFVLNAMDRWTGDERAWLRAELDRALAEPGLAHRIAVMHWGPYSSSTHGGNPALKNGEVVEMMRDRKVDLVLAGHDHVYERGAGRGLKYVITGGAGAPLYDRKSDAPETLRFESAYHFLEIAVDGDRVTVTARRPDRAVLETCGYQGMGPWDCAAERPAMDPAGATRPRAGSGCGCAVPGSSVHDGWPGAATLALATALARRRRRW